MYKRIIKVSIVFCIIVNVALVYSMEACASPIQKEQANTTKDANSQIAEMIEGAQDASPDILLEERKETDSTNSVRTESAKTIASYNPNEYKRIVTVGDLPAGHDPSLVLRKGRNIKVDFVLDLVRRKSFLDDMSVLIIENIYDDSGQVLLVPRRTRMNCFYNVSEEQDKIKIYITVWDMFLDLSKNISVTFSDPPHCTTNFERKKQAFSPFTSADVIKREEYLEQLREQLFISPVISAEVILSVVSEDRATERGEIVFSENASGDRTVSFVSRYGVDLQVRKYILFSHPSPELENTRHPRRL